MKGFSPGGYVPLCLPVLGWAHCTHPGSNPTSTSPLGRRKPKICSTLGCRWQLETLGQETASWAAWFCSFPICSTQFPAGRSVLFVPALNRWVPWAWAWALELCPVLGPVLGSPPRSCQVSAPGICPFSRLSSNLLLGTVGWETSILVIFPSLPKLSKLLHALVEAMGPVWLQALARWGRALGLLKALRDSFRAL